MSVIPGAAYYVDKYDAEHKVLYITFYSNENKLLDEIKYDDQARPPFDSRGNFRGDMLKTRLDPKCQHSYKIDTITMMECDDDPDAYFCCMIVNGGYVAAFRYPKSNSVTRTAMLKFISDNIERFNNRCYWQKIKETDWPGFKIQEAVEEFTGKKFLDLDYLLKNAVVEIVQRKKGGCVDRESGRKVVDS